MAKGRKTGGKQLGFKAPKTLEKLEAREVLRQLVTQHMVPMTQAQIDNALGIKHLMMRDPASGKFERIATDTTQDPDVQKAQIDAALGTGNAFWIYTKDPAIQAYMDLMNRALDKPKEQALEVKLEGELKSRTDAELAALVAAILPKLTTQNP